ncbi:MAG TPA: hypothetical protein DCP91_07050 [Eggerthellaceae bacterium]|nr:hypothetical protein [Eggerthellaceae bacterium]
MGVIHTGVGHWQLSWTDELLSETEAARARAAVLGPTSSLVLRQLVVGEVSQLSELVGDTQVSDRELCERCLALRGGPFAEGPLRRNARERARAWLFLSNDPKPPAHAEKLLSFYEVANRLEPHFCETLPARYRTAEDPMPFTRVGLFDRRPAPPECETDAGDDIPGDVDALLHFVGRGDLPAEWVAFASYFLLLRIHPFRDGNGHVARMLVLALLAPHYGTEQLVRFVARMQERREDLGGLLGDIRLQRSDIGDLAAFMLSLLDESRMREERQ